MGESMGINAIVLGEKEGKTLFVAQELPSDGATEAQVEQYLIDEYNAPPMGMESISDKLADIIWPAGGKEGYRARCTIIDPRCEGEADQYEAAFHAAGEEGDKALKTLKEFGKPLTRESVKEPFGLNKEEIIDFNVAMIEELVRCPLSKISLNLVTELWGKTHGKKNKGAPGK